ncbi:MAG: pentapeptide repeat-containing protein [Prevotellaceae bacterium]|nr:pentapeptide repeat-containing protein [Prevotellaceae bacterium]
MKRLIIKTMLVLLIQAVVVCLPKIAYSKVPEIQASSIIKQLNAGKHLCIEHSIIWGDLDFTKLNNRNKIAGNLTQVFISQSITFVDCIFLGNIRAYDAKAGISVEFMHNLSFTGCDFRGDVDFTESIVGGHTFFTRTVFRGDGRFQGTHFRHKKAYFNETRFEGEALFQNAVFAGDANFLHAVFESSAMFQKTVVGGLFFLGNAQFNGYADFTYARAVESIFRYAKFGNRYDFSDSNLNADQIEY